MPGDRIAIVSLDARCWRLVRRAERLARPRCRRRPAEEQLDGFTERSMTVDSSPTSVGPPSTIMSMRPSRSASTWDARVGLGRENRFALGAATGRPAYCDQCPRDWDATGTRMATVARPAVTSSRHTRTIACSTIVSGPGQKRAASSRAASRHLDDERRHVVNCRDVNDQRIVGGPLLRGEQSLDRASIERMRTEPVDGLGRKCDEPAGAQAFGGARDQSLVRIVGIDP